MVLAQLFHYVLFRHQQPFQTRGHIFMNLEIAFRGSKRRTPFVPSLAWTANTQVSDKRNVRFGASKSSLSLLKNKTQLSRNRLAKPTMQLCAIFPKLLLATSG